ncbi:MAG: hypothetical protein ACRES7_00170 [Gammaproteobacteria bacterium]
MMRKAFFIAALAALASATSAQAAPTGPSHINANVAGCQSQALFDKIATIAAEGDKQTAEELLAEGVNAGQCVALTSGEAVYIEDMTTDGRLVKIRPKGQVYSYWTGAMFVTP